MHHENLASKTLPPELMNMQKHVIKLINTIKSSALKTRLFRRFYEQIYTESSLPYQGVMAVKRQRA